LSGAFVEAERVASDVPVGGPSDRMRLDAATVTVIAATFLFAGSVKGLTGLGLPAIVLGILTATIGIQPAKALILVPTLLTNVVQACVGGHGRALIRRTWPFLLAATALAASGALTLPYFDAGVMSCLLGVVLLVYGASGLFQIRLRIPERGRHLAGVLFGATNGFVTGLTGSSSVPGVFYLQSIALSRDELIQGMGILFTLSAIGLALSLGMQDLLSKELGAMSAVAVLPALLGMSLGQRIRRRIPETQFRTVFHIALSLLGLYIALRNLP
jgi:uncharacterized membrane protein YfcA